MAALIAPRPFMVERGHFDGVAPDERVALEFAKVRHTYQAKLDGVPSDGKLEKLKKGISIVGGKVRATHIKRLKKGNDRRDWIQITITEGKNRQIRKMFEKIGFDVLKLKRVAIGELKLGPLKTGDYRPLNQKDLMKLFHE